MSALRRVGHKGADLIVPGNTPASFDAALAHGVDMIEFDVLPENQNEPEKGRLLLAHDYEHVESASTLEQGLAHLAGAAFAGLDLDVDLKLPGYERRVVDALREHGLVERTLISSNWMRSLIVLRELEPKLRLGYSVPRLRKDPTQMWLTKLPAYGLAAWVRMKLPSAIKVHMAAGRCDALMCHWRLVSARLVKAVNEAGGELYVWTVDDGRRIGRLEKLGVTGVITNDPRLFSQLPSAHVAAE
jgi:glycerophosphoryl diester phosphodiesterase